MDSLLIAHLQVERRLYRLCWAQNSWPTVRRRQPGLCLNNRVSFSQQNNMYLRILAGKIVCLPQSTTPSLQSTSTQNWFRDWTASIRTTRSQPSPTKRGLHSCSIWNNCWAPKQNLKKCCVLTSASSVNSQLQLRNGSTLWRNIIRTNRTFSKKLILTGGWTSR